MASIRSFATHPATKTGVATLIAYTFLLGLLLILVFAVPFVLFRLL